MTSLTPARPWSHALRVRWTNARDRLLTAAQLSRAGRTPYTVIHRDGLVQVRHYARQGGAATTPLVLVAPLAVNMLIYDLFPERSLIQYFTAAGRDVYLIDWGRPGRRHNHYDLACYVLDLLPPCLAAVRQHAGQRALDLHGWSMGGHFILCYAGLGRDADLRRLVILGTSIDSHASGTLGQIARNLHQGALWLQSRAGIDTARWPQRWFYSPGWRNSLNFKLTTPRASLRAYVDLLRHLDDRAYIIEHATYGAFLDHMVAYPGGVAKDMFLGAWLSNSFRHGRLRLRDQDVDFRRIRQPLLVMAGAEDSMASAAAVGALMSLTASVEQRFVVVPGGHMGILAGREAVQTAWATTLAWLQS